MTKKRKRNYKKSNNKLVVIILSVILLSFLGVFILNKNYSNTYFKEFTYRLSKPFSILSVNINDIVKYKEYKNENRKLKKMKMENDFLSNYNSELKDEISALKKLSKIDYKGYSLVYGNVICRNKLYWFDEFTIDIGSNNKVRVNDAVIGTDGLIGKVKSVSKNIAVVSLITSNTKMKTSVMINTSKGNKTGLITGYKDGFLEVLGITNYDGVKLKDKVYTSGLGNLPRGIYIGEVSLVKEDSYGVSNILYIKSMQDMNDIYFVGVLTSS